MSKLKNFLDKNLETTKGKILATIIAIVFFYLFYAAFIWINTQSTDNAYVEGEITFVSPEVNGVIESINFVENQKVSKGDLLLKINDLTYNALYEQAKSAYESGKLEIAIIESQTELAKIDLSKAEDSLKLAELNYQNASKEFQRISKLTSDNFSSKKLSDDTYLLMKKASIETSQALSTTKTARENLSMLELKKQASLIKLKSLEDAMIIAEYNLNATQIKAPIDGVVTSSSARIGGFARAGLQLFSIVPKKNFYIKANFKETQIEKFNPGMTADIKIDVIKSHNFKGKIRGIYPATGSKFSLIPTDSATGNFTKIVQRVPVIIDIEIPKEYEDKIGIGYSSKVSIRTDR